MFDGQVVRPPQQFKDVAREFVCVRVTNIDEVDVNQFPFDYDLTMAIVLANADGTVYHRYGGRYHLSPMRINTLVEIMSEGLLTHRTYMTHPSPPEPKPSQRVSDLINRQLKGRIKPIYGCFHCHYVREARQTLAAEAGTWRPDQFWIWPLPERIGLVMDQDQQYRVARVLPNSAADQAGLREGDLLNSLGAQRVLTKYDIQWILDQSDGNTLELPYSLRRDGELQSGRLSLGPGWKVGDPDEYAWRVRNVYTEHMDKFLPAPGFSGKRLSGRELEELGLAEDEFALKITRLNYGTYLAGIRMGDVVLGAGGKSEFASPRDFYHWCELLRRAGRDIRMELVRQSTSMQVMVSSSHLNYSRAARAPRVMLGFIVQELPGNDGLRVGHVTDESSAEKTGLRHGDRIVSVDGQLVDTPDSLAAILNNKAPGDLLAIEVTREGKPLYFSFVLPGREETRSDLARLSEIPKEAGQELDCIVTIKLPTGNHVYSVHKKGFGLPTDLEFRGRGCELVGPIEEPPPRLIDDGGIDRMWVLEGDVTLRQKIRVTDPLNFQLFVRLYAQVCDELSCHELRAIIGNDGRGTVFSEFRGHFDQQPVIRAGVSSGPNP